MYKERSLTIRKQSLFPNKTYGLTILRTINFGIPYNITLRNRNLHNNISLTIDYTISLHKLTIEEPVTRSYMGTLASARASPAHVIAADNADPSFCNTRAYTSTWKLGNSCYKNTTFCL